MIEIKVSWLLDIERNVPMEKIQKTVKNCFLKLLLKGLVDIVKVVHCSTKLFMVDFLSNVLHEKVMMCYLN